MWAIFLLSALTVAIIALIIVYIGHRVIMAIENEREKNKINKEKEGKENE